MHSPDQRHEADSREIVVRNIDFVRRLIVGMLGPSQTVDDLVQDVFLRVLRAKNSFRGESNEQTWIYRIATRVIYDHIDER